MVFFLYVIFFIEDVFAGPNLSGTYQLQTPMSELEKEKKTALERTVQSADWLYQISISMRLKDKPHICETYVLKQGKHIFTSPCDSLETLIVPISETKKNKKEISMGKQKKLKFNFIVKKRIYRI